MFQTSPPLDERVWQVENYLPPLIGKEEDMPTDKQTLDLHNRVAKIEGSLVTIKVMIGLLVVILVPGIWGAVNFGVHMGERVSHLEGEKGDPLGAAVKGIESPGSRQQLDANLSLLTGQILVDEAEGRKGKPENLTKISSAVRVASTSNPDDPEVWRAATQLISYRSSKPSALHNCFDIPYKEGPHQDPNGSLYVLRLSDCTLVLDDESAFENSVAYRAFLAHMSQLPNPDPEAPPLIVLALNRVNVVYNGAKPLNVASVMFRDCSFDFNAPTAVPPDKGKVLMRGVLTADLAQPFRVSFVPGA